MKRSHSKPRQQRRENAGTPFPSPKQQVIEKPVVRTYVHLYVQKKKHSNFEKREKKLRELKSVVF